MLMPSDDVGKRITEHLRAHPQMCDTLEGIVQWWMTFQQVDESILEIREALERLKAEGIIDSWTAGDNRTFYFAGDKTRDNN